MIIAVDGPAAAGKGTIARALAKHFGFHFLDTGSLYRMVGLATLRAGGEPITARAAIAAAQGLNPLKFSDAELRTEQVGVAASIVATVPEVRAAFDKQKSIEYAISEISGKDLDVTKVNDKLVIAFSYDKEIPLGGPVYLLIRYEGRSK